jgi:hypothetical protein
MTQSITHIARPRAPGWLSCELCERTASRPHRRLRLTLVRHSEEQQSPDHDDRPGDDRPHNQPNPHGAERGSDPADTRDRQARDVARKDAANPATLVLLCSDCCALIVGAIDDDEWRRRIDHSPARADLAQLPSPNAP